MKENCGFFGSAKCRLFKELQLLELGGFALSVDEALHPSLKRVDQILKAKAVVVLQQPEDSLLVFFEKIHLEIVSVRQDGYSSLGDIVAYSGALK